MKEISFPPLPPSAIDVTQCSLIHHGEDRRSSPTTPFFHSSIFFHLDIIKKKSSSVIRSKYSFPLRSQLNNETGLPDEIFRTHLGKLLR